MLSGSKQTQTVSDNGVAVQATGDVIMHAGLSITDVRLICSEYLRDNFPRLRETANETARKRVNEFASTLDKRLTIGNARPDLEKFADPDVQATLNDAVQAIARGGENASPTVLASLIAARVSEGTTAFKDLVLREAVHVVPRLTAQHIDCLSAIVAVTCISPSSTATVNQVASLGKNLLEAVSNAFGIPRSQLAHLQYSGAASVDNLTVSNWYEEINKRCPHLGLADGAAFKKMLEQHAPSYASLLLKYQDERFDAIRLTSVGQAIGITNLANKLPELLQLEAWQP